MGREIDLDFSVHFSDEQVEFLYLMLRGASIEKQILVKTVSEKTDWKRTAKNVVKTCALVYISLLLIQAKREQRGILHFSIELAKERRQLLMIMEQLTGRAPSSDQLLGIFAEWARCDATVLGLVQDPVARDIHRLLAITEAVVVLPRKTTPAMI